MPKRSLDASNVPPTTTTMQLPEKPVPRKTERSHEENQERAYIAASRRADRSIEARVKSAQMASEIHKKRTGKGFKISERIVQAEEMYEEEDDDMPRSFRNLAAHLQTGSPDLNYRVNAFLANRVAMASMVAGMRNEDWLQNPINKMFAEQFPNADKQAQAMSHRLSNSSYYTPIAGQEGPRPESFSPSSPMSPALWSMEYQPQGHFPMSSRSQSIAMSPVDERSNAMSPPMSPGTVATPPSRHSFSHAPPPEAHLYANSAFTAELPPEAKMMVGLDMTDPLSPVFMGGRDSMPQYYPDRVPDLKQEEYEPNGFSLSHEYYDMTPQQILPSYPDFDDQQGNVETPAPPPTNDWDTYMDWSGCGEGGTDSFRG